jgi:transposase InsO family protein
VNEVNDFMEQFSTHYQDKLREVFPRLVSHYMRQALKKSKLVKDYDLVISRTPFEDRDWKVVSDAVDEILQLQTIRQEVKLLLFGFRANKDEDPITYCKRFRDLVRMAHAEDMGRHLSELIYQSLPTQGREFLDREYPDGVQKVEDYSSVLDLLSKMHSAFKGSRTQAGMHIAARWAPHAIARSNGGSESNKSSKNVSATVLGKRPADSSLSRDHGSKKSELKKPKVFCSEDVCKHFAARVGKPHLDSNCWRHLADETKWSKFKSEEEALIAKERGGQGRSQSYHSHSTNSQGSSSKQPYSKKAVAAISHGSKKKVKTSEKAKTHSVAATKRRARSDSDDESEDEHYAKMNEDGDDDDDDTYGNEHSYDASAIKGRFGSSSSYFSSPNAGPFIYVKKVCAAFKGRIQGENRMVLPIEINGQRFTALLDPGATVSLISPATAEELDVETRSPEDPITVLANGTQVEVSETVGKVDLLCNGERASARVFVMDLDDYDCFVGMDLFTKFGFAITGFKNPLLGPSARYEEVLIENDEEPEIVARERPEKENTEEFKNERASFLEAIKPLLEKNASIDPKSYCDHPLMTVDLKIPPGVTVYQRPHGPIPERETEKVREQIKQWLADGVIVPTKKQVPHLNQLTLAARRDLEGNILKTRLCLDPRNLNSHLIGCDNFELPNITKILEKAAGHKYFSTIDLRQAYHRLPLTENSQPLTSFSFEGKQYMFARAPFGLKPMTSIFQRGMVDILDGFDWVAIYVDDIVIFSKTAEEHLIQVKEVLKRLTDYKLIVNPEKCHFFYSEIVLLGFIINEHGRRIDPEKIANISTWAEPTNGKMIQRYLGMFNHFREYIPLISTLCAPLDRMRNKKGTFKLNHIQSKCFQKLKLLVQQAPVLSFPNWSLRFYVATDASNLGIGCVLYQLPNGPNDESKINYISFMARSLKKHELNYPAYKKELLGIVYSLKKFAYYLTGRPFTLFTDHRPLTYMHDQADLPTTIANWRETLLKFDFECVYRPGMLNVIPDALSRAFPDELWNNTAPETAVKLSLNQKSRAGRIQAVAAVSTRSAFRSETTSSTNEGLISVMSNQLAQSLDGIEIDPTAAYVHDMQVGEQERIVPDANEQARILKEIHSFGHLGANAMVEAIHRRGFEWPKLKNSCLNHVSSCPQCQHYNIARKGYHPLQAIHATLPGEHISIDTATFTMSEAGNVHALIVVDVCTRFVFLEAIPDKAATTIAGRLFKLFCLIGFPKILQSDNGSEFVNQINHALLKIMGIDHRLTTPYHPRANGLAERNVRKVKDLLPKLIAGQTPLWDVSLPMAQLQLNCRITSIHNSTPFSLFYGRSFPGLTDFSSAESHLLNEKQALKRLEYLTNLVYPAISEKAKATQQKMISAFNKAHRLIEFPTGSYVMVKDPVASTPLDPKYDGPYKVVRRTPRGTYVLQDSLNQFLSRNFAPEQIKLVSQSLDIPTQESEHFEVEKVLNHRLSDKGEMLYTVQWKGYPESENSEIPYENFDSKKAISLYYQRINKKNPHVIATHVKRLSNKQERVTRMVQNESSSSITRRVMRSAKL